MVYLRVKTRVMAKAGQKLMLGDVADLLADASLHLHEMRVSLPQKPGIWEIDALQIILQIQEKLPDEVINVLGDGTGWLHLEREKAPKRTARVGLSLRVVAACLLLAVGAALAIGWFHADVNMSGAQRALYTAVAGEEPTSPLLVALPYALGVGLGVALYYALIGRKTVSPLTIKLREYHESVERNSKQGDSHW